MKTIMVMFDSLNRHLLSPYGCKWTKTPNFDRLAQRTTTFCTAYAGSLPCMPARRELHTGRYNFLHRSWGPLEPFDDSVPEILKKEGIYTHLISDHSHYWEDGGATYHNRYHTWEGVRGQEGDCWKAQAGPVEIPPHLGQLWPQDVINRSYTESEEDKPQAKTFRLGLKFLEQNYRSDNWFLQIETFDPHEPFYSSKEYHDLYPEKEIGIQFDWPEYAEVTETPEETEHCRYEYAALLSMCDHYLGKVLDFMDEHRMWDDTMLIVNTDHGFLLSEHGCWGKCSHPLYEEISHIPLFIWDPRYPAAGETRDALVQTIDIPATVLEFFGIDRPKGMRGKPIAPVLKSDEPIREGALFGLHGSQICITDGRYVYMRDPNPENGPLFEYTLMPLHMRCMFQKEELAGPQLAAFESFTKGIPVLKYPALRTDATIGPSHFGTMLFDLENDPGQMHPIHDEETEERLLHMMFRMLEENDCPREQFIRMGMENLCQ